MPMSWRAKRWNDQRMSGRVIGSDSCPHVAPREKRGSVNAVSHSHEEDQDIVRAHAVLSSDTFCDLISSNRGRYQQQEHAQQRG